MASIPTDEDLKDAIKQFKADKPQSNVGRFINFARTEKNWNVSEGRVKATFAELGFQKSAQNENSLYLESRMESLFLSGTGDMRFIVGSQREIATAHSLIVNHNCPLLLQSYPLKDDKTVDVPDVSFEAFSIFLSFLYIGRIKKATANVAVELFRLGMKVGDSRLSSLCVDTIISDVNVNNVCEIFAECINKKADIPDTDAARLRRHCANFFHSHQSEVTSPSSTPTHPHSAANSHNRAAAPRAPARSRVTQTTAADYPDGGLRQAPCRAPQGAHALQVPGGQRWVAATGVDLTLLMEN